jgi:ethanolamine utilization protein EutN
MQVGVIVGHGVSTVKHPSLVGWKLLLVKLLTPDGKSDGEPVLAIDSLGAGIGARVVVSNDGAAVQQAVGTKKTPLRWMVIGLCDG